MKSNISTEEFSPFPMVIACTGCATRYQIDQPRSFTCPHCGSDIRILEDRKVLIQKQEESEVLIPYESETIHQEDFNEETEIQKLLDINHEVRKLAAERLGRHGSSKAVIPLIKVLGDTNFSLIISAVVALGRIGDSRASRALVLLRKESDDPQMTSATSRALRQIKYSTLANIVSYDIEDGKMINLPLDSDDFPSNKSLKTVKFTNKPKEKNTIKLVNCPHCNQKIILNIYPKSDKKRKEGEKNRITWV